MEKKLIFIRKTDNRSRSKTFTSICQSYLWTLHIMKLVFSISKAISLALQDMNCEIAACVITEQNKKGVTNVNNNFIWISIDKLENLLSLRMLKTRYKNCFTYTLICRLNKLVLFLTEKTKVTFSKRLTFFIGFAWKMTVDCHKSWTKERKLDRSICDKKKYTFFLH